MAGYSNYIKRLIQYILPAVCQHCQDYIPVGDTLGQACCPACLDQLKPKLCYYKTHISQTPALSCLEYTGVIRALLHQLKFLGDQSVIPLIQALIRPHISEKSRIVPLLGHSSRKKERGFDPVEAIFKPLLPQAYTPCLVRHKKTPKLYNQTAETRYALLNGAFTLSQTIKVPDNQPVVLVDDIYTSGSTAESAITCLKNHGVTCLSVFTVCHRIV